MYIYDNKYLFSFNLNRAPSAVVIMFVIVQLDNLITICVCSKYMQMAYWYFRDKDKIRIRTYGSVAQGRVNEFRTDIPMN